VIKKGEIWLVRLDPTEGAEINKERPCAVVNNDAIIAVVNDDDIGVLPLKIVVPISEWKDRYSKAPWHVHLIASEKNGLDKNSTADTFQVRSISEERFKHKIGSLSPEDLENIKKGLSICLCIE
jgi:mRNA interferase MazF